MSQPNPGPAAHPELAICGQCDSVHQRLPLAPGEAADCQVCGAPLYRRPKLDVEAMLALSLAALIVFVLANAAPIVTMESGGTTTRGWLLTMVASTWSSGVGVVAVILSGTVFLFPLTQIGLYFYVLLACRLGLPAARFAAAMHLLHLLRPWSMVEVFLVGILVSIIKMSHLASVKPEPGLWAFGMLTILLTALGTFELRELWTLREERQNA